MEKATKILIGGTQGAGKSTLANILGNELSIPVYYVDRIFFNSKWKMRHTEIVQKEIENISCRESWILDGYWEETNGSLYKKADLVIYINRSRFFCYKNIIKRRIKSFFHNRPETPDNSDNKIYFSLLKKVWANTKEHRNNLIKKLAENERNTRFIVIDKCNKSTIFELINNIKNLGETEPERLTAKIL